MKLTDALSSHVTHDVRLRGQSYFRAGAVTLDMVDASAVSGLVQGTKSYQVDLILKGREVHAWCTCPYYEDHADVCKHIWATVLAAGPEGFAKKAAVFGRLQFHIEYCDESDDRPIHPKEYAPLRQSYRAPPPPVVAPWKVLLAAIRTEVQPRGGAPAVPVTTHRQLVCIVDAAASLSARKLVLELNSREIKPNGKLNSLTAKHTTAANIGDYSDPVDRQLLALINGAEPINAHYGYYSSSSSSARHRISETLLETLLPLLAQAGRIGLRRQSRSSAALENLTVDQEEPWKLVIAIARGPKKDWSVAGSLRRGAASLPLTKPDLIVPGLVVWEGRLGRFEAAGGFGWVAPLQQAGTITVPASKAEELLGEFFRMPGTPQVELPPELKVTEEAVPPIPRLTVKSAEDYYGTPILIADLSFQYGDAVVPMRPASRGVYQRDGRRLILRDATLETAAEQLLVRLGARAGRSSQTGTMELKPSQLPGLVRELVPAGWKIEAEGKLYRPAGVFDIAVKSETDWFDLNATADFDGQQVPFPRLLAALRRGESTILLDDGTFGMVPDEWLNKYSLIARMGTVEGDALRFSRAQVGLLDALLASRPEIAFDRQFATARDELRKFTGVAPQDPPKGFVGELREYQREGLGWLRFLRQFGVGGCLADDMGLGKTVQVLALLAGKRKGPALVVVPKSLIFNWKQESARFTPQLKVLDHTGADRDRAGASFKNYDLVLTTYGTLRNDAEAFADIRFDTCVLDESQAAKNATTETAKAVRVVRADHRLAMSGTPVENHLGELWTLFDFLNPGLLGRTMPFGATKNPDAETREVLARALKPFLLRRTKAQVAKDLPAKTEQTVYCDLEPAQQKLYDELRDHYRQSLLARVDTMGLGRSKIMVIEALLRLRQAACHPGLIDKTRTAETSAKLEVLLPQLRDLAEGGGKALVFSQFTSLLAIVKKRLDAEGTPYEYLDGKTRDRAERVERFQTDPACKLFLVSLKAGGVGLNLTAAEYVFLLDPWWNPAVEAQAIDRSHRIGQTKPVFAYRLIARGTVEEKVLALQQSKRELADAILGGDGRLLADLKREDLELLLS